MNQVYLVSFCILLLGNAAFGQVSTSLSFAPVAPMNDLFGINFNWWVRGDVYNNMLWPAGSTNTNNSYQNSYLHKFFDGIGSTVVRYPGGTTSTFWNVTSSTFVDTSSPVCQTMAASSVYTVKCTNYNAAITPNLKMGGPAAMTLQAYGEQMAAAGIEWLYVANLYTTPAQEIIDAINSVCSPGNPACPTYLELGNEYYLTQYFPTSIMPNSSLYMDLCEQVYNATSQYFPGRISGLTSYSGFAGSQPTNTQVQWNSGLFGRSGTAYDHLTIHIYTLQASNFDSNPTWSWYTLMLAWPETAIRVTYDKYITQFPDTVKLWVTEFNYNAAVSSSTGDAAATFAQAQRQQPSHGLFLAGFYLSMFQYPNVFTKALLFESLRDNFLSSYLVDNTGAYAYAPGQIFGHLAYIMRTSDSFAGLNFPGVDTIPKLSWYNSYSKTLNALQGAIFNGTGNSGLTYVIMNRVNYTISVSLSESAPYQSVTIYNYAGNVTISTMTYPIDIDNQVYPLPGPIPVTTAPRTNTNGAYTADLAPLSLTILHFDFDAIVPQTTLAPTQAPTPLPTLEPTQAPTPQPTLEPTQAPTPLPTLAPTQAPTPAPTESPIDACRDTVWFEQTQQSMSPYSAQWLVRIHTTSSALYSPKIRVSPAPLSLWNLNPVSGDSTLYTIPDYEFENGVIPAQRSCITFSYTTSGGPTPVDFTLDNNACAPVTEGCSATVTNQLVAEWTSSNVLFQQYTLNVANTGHLNIASTQVDFALNPQTSFYQYWNLAAVSGSTSSFNVYTSTIFAGSSNGNGGYQVTTPGGTAGTTYISLASSTPVCTSA